MTAATSYEYPRIEGPGKAYYMRLGEDTSSRTGFGKLDRPTPRGQGVSGSQASYSARNRYRGTTSRRLQCLQRGRSEGNVLVGANAAAATCPPFGRRPPLSTPPCARCSRSSQTPSSTSRCRVTHARTISCIVAATSACTRSSKTKVMPRTATPTSAMRSHRSGCPPTTSTTHSTSS